MRRAHWLPPNARTMIPRCHICVGTSVTDTSPPAGRNKLLQVASVPLTFEGERSGMGTMQTHSDPEQFWGGMWLRCALRGTTWIWLLSPRQDLIATQFARLVESGRFVRDWWVFADPPMILSGRLDGRKVKIVGVGNWLPGLVDEAADVSGNPPWLTYDPASDVIRDVGIAEVRARRCATLVGRILSFVHTEDLGHLRTTVGGQAMQSFRHRHLRHKILVEDNPKAIALERSCALGVPLDVHAKGKVPGPVYIVDVNALYPWIMGQYPYPRKLLWYSEVDSPENLKRSMGRCLLIARITGRTALAPVMVQRDGKCQRVNILERDVLCGPELDRVLTQGRVDHVHEAAGYEAAPLFCAWSPWAWDLRQRAKSSGDKIASAIAKTLTVSLWGQFAARPYRWVPCPDSPPDPVNGYGTWLWTHSDQCEEMRTIAGITDRLEIRDEPDNSIPSIAAFVACYQRTYMDSLMVAAGVENVHCRVADALHVSKLGFANLLAGGFVNPHRFGALKVSQVVNDAMYHAPNVHRLDGLWTFAGCRVNAEQVGPATWRWAGQEPLKKAVLKPPTGVVSTYTREVSLERTER